MLKLHSNQARRWHFSIKNIKRTDRIAIEDPGSHKIWRMPNPGPRISVIIFWLYREYTSLGAPFKYHIFWGITSFQQTRNLANLFQTVAGDGLIPGITLKTGRKSCCCDTWLRVTERASVNVIRLHPIIIGIFDEFKSTYRNFLFDIYIFYMKYMLADKIFSETLKECRLDRSVWAHLRLDLEAHNAFRSITGKAFLDIYLLQK
jgi:hypothetical protein